jgi:hypothetical protein
MTLLSLRQIPVVFMLAQAKVPICALTHIDN